MSTRFPENVYQWMKNIQYWCLPATCIVCRKPSDTRRDLCRSCEAGLPGITRPCLCCGLPLPPGYAPGKPCGTCQVCPPPFSCLLAPFDYAPPMSALVTAFKYHGRMANGRILTTLLAQKLAQHYQYQTLPDLLVPVPLHNSRIRQRGFNQALVMARWLSQQLGVPVNRHMVKRRRATSMQAGLSAAARKRNLKQAFALQQKTPVAPGITVALVDDVVTTGVTVSEITKVLHKAGVENIHVWALARTCL